MFIWVCGFLPMSDEVDCRGRFGGRDGDENAKEQKTWMQEHIEHEFSIE